MTKGSDSPPSVLLIGYYGYRNLGDSLFLKLILERIETLAPSGTRVLVKDLLPSENPTLGLEVLCAPFDAVLADSSINRLTRAVTFYRLLRRTMSNVSVVIYGGGSLFHSRELRNLAVLITLNHVARRSQCEIIAVGVGVPRPRGILRRILLKRILSHLDAISVRDSVSHEVCVDLSSPKRCILASDLAFLEKVPTTSVEATLDVVFTISASDSHSMERLSRIAPLIKQSLEVISRSGCTLGFMSFQEHRSSTARVSDLEVWSRLFRDCWILFDRNIHAPCDFRDALEVVGNYRCLVGMRYHSLVAAACLRKPFIGLGDDPKLVALCETFAMQRISLDDFSSESFIKAVNNARWSSVQDVALERERVFALENESLLAEVFQ